MQPTGRYFVGLRDVTEVTFDVSMILRMNPDSSLGRRRIIAHG